MKQSKRSWAGLMAIVLLSTALLTSCNDTEWEPSYETTRPTYNNENDQTEVSTKQEHDDTTASNPISETTHALEDTTEAEIETEIEIKTEDETKTPTSTHPETETEIPTFSAGEKWIVDGKFELSFEDALQTVVKDGKQTVQVTWKYKNLGAKTKLNISLNDFDVYDAEMEKGKWTLYDVEYKNPSGAGCVVGGKATCKCGWILENHSETIKIYVELMNDYAAWFVLDVTIPEPETETETQLAPHIYSVGETWIVDGNWEFTVKSVKTHYLCNSSDNNMSGYTNEQVIQIEYTYKNIGFTKDLFFSSIAFDVYDETGESATTYSCYMHQKYPQPCILGTTCTATETYVLFNNSSEITLRVSSKYVSAGSEASAVFKLKIT